MSKFLTELGDSKTLDVIGVAVLLFSLAFCGLGLARLQTNTEDVLQWLPDDSPARLEFNEFRRKFGSDDFLVVTWKDCTSRDPRLLEFSQSILEQDSEDLIQSVTSGASLIQELTRNNRLSRRAVEKRFQGIFFGVEDIKQTMLIVELSPKGSENRKQSLQLVDSVIEEIPDLAYQDVTFGGYPYVGVSVDRQMKGSFQYFLIPSVLLASLVSLYCLKDFFLSTIVFIAASAAAACSVAIVPVCGLKFGGLMSIIPALVYILATSGSIHLVHYSLEAIGNPFRLIAIGWKPCCISTLTTAVGMLSLTRSTFPAIRNFGFFCASGALFALMFQLLLVPWLLSRFGKSGQIKMAKRSHASGVWTMIGAGVKKQRWILSIAGVAMMLLATAGLFKLSACVDVEKLFDPDSEMITSLTELEARLGPIDQSEILVQFLDVDAEDFRSRVKFVTHVQRALNGVTGVGSTCSLLNYLPNEPAGKKLSSFVKRRVYQNSLDGLRSNLDNNRLLNVEGNSETWRISLRFPFIEETDFSDLRDRILDAAAKAVNDSFVRNEFASMTSPVKLIYTGKTHLFHNAQETLLEDLFQNFFLAFVIITPVLIIVLRSWSLGLIAMLPNLFPVVMLFGGLGWVDMPVDLALAMTACVALGIAVDDTTHFLIRFREFGGMGDNVLSALNKALAQCGPAMLHTTLIGSAGLAVYGFTDMVVVRHFSLAICLMLMLALVADILMLPALVLLLRGKKDSGKTDQV